MCGRNRIGSQLASPFSYRLQFLPLLCVRFRIIHLLSSSALTVIRETESRAFPLSSAGTTYQGASLVLLALKALIIGPHIVLPEFPPHAVRKAKCPVLFGLIDTRRKALALLLLRKLEEELDAAGSIEVKLFLQITIERSCSCPTVVSSGDVSGSPSLQRILRYTWTISTSS
jgi:hypothetical protein